MLKKFVYALVEANIGLIVDDDVIDCGDEYNFVWGQLQAMPGIFGLGLKVVTIAFSLATGLLCCRSAASRRRLIARLNQTQLPVLRELATFYQGLTVLAYYQEAATKSNAR